MIQIVIGVKNLKGNLTELKALSLEDLTRLHLWRNDPEVSLWAVGNSPFYTYVSKEFVENTYDTLMNLNKQEAFVFSVYTHDKEHIGIADYRDVNPITRVATIGITIGNQAYWGKGYGTDALNLLVKFLFLHLNLRRIQLDTWSGNERAIRAYKRCGFKIEGSLRQHAYVNGIYYDTVIMGLLRDEWSQGEKDE